MHRPPAGQWSSKSLRFCQPTISWERNTKSKRVGSEAHAATLPPPTSLRGHTGAHSYPEAAGGVSPNPNSTHYWPSCSLRQLVRWTPASSALITKQVDKSLCVERWGPPQTSSSKMAQSKKNQRKVKILSRNEIVRWTPGSTALLTSPHEWRLLR